MKNRQMYFRENISLAASFFSCNTSSGCSYCANLSGSDSILVVHDILYSSSFVFQHASPCVYFPCNCVTSNLLCDIFNNDEKLVISVCPMKSKLNHDRKVLILYSTIINIYLACMSGPLNGPLSRIYDYKW